MLYFPDFNKVFQVVCDESGNAIRAILSQGGKHVAFFSENLNDSKRKCFVYDQNFYAIIQSLKKWKHFIIPKEFLLYTGHKDL